MGADITVDGRLAVVRGVGQLSGANVCAMDLRGGAALVVAGLGGARAHDDYGCVSYRQRI